LRVLDEPPDGSIRPIELPSEGEEVKESI
jgi:hypothetical protein